MEHTGTATSVLKPSPNLLTKWSHYGTITRMNTNSPHIDKHAVLARTAQGAFRVGGLSTWKNAQRRWSAATNDGRNTTVTVRAFLDGKWVDLDGDLCVRSADDPMAANAQLANNRKLTGTDSATVRAAARRGAKVL